MASIFLLYSDKNNINSCSQEQIEFHERRLLYYNLNIFERHEKFHKERKYKKDPSYLGCFPNSIPLSMIPLLSPQNPT